MLFQILFIFDPFSVKQTVAAAVLTTAVGSRNSCFYLFWSGWVRI